MRMSEMSRRIALVVSRTRRAKMKVQIGSAICHCGSSYRKKMVPLDTEACCHAHI